MNIKKIVNNNMSIAIIESDELVLTDVQSALDLMASIRYETGCSRMVLNRTAISEDFFKLSTRVAGEILQKFINYHVKFAIIGDFSIYDNTALKDFIYESNNGKDIFFVSNEDEAIEKLVLDK